MQLIEEQQRGEFRPVCRSCDFYKSIYHKRAEYRFGRMAVQSVAEFKTRLDGTELDPKARSSADSDRQAAGISHFDFASVPVRAIAPAAS